VGEMAEECSSSFVLFQVELLEEVGQREQCQRPVGLLEEEVGGEEEEWAWMREELGELNHQRAVEVLLEHWRPKK